MTPIDINAKEDHHMPYQLSTAVLPDDYVSIAAVLNACRTLQTSPADLAQERACWPAGSISHLIVAKDDAGLAAGFADAYRLPNTAEGKFYVNVCVHPAHRRQGLGSTLLAEIHRFVTDRGGSRIEGEFEDTNAAARPFLEKRGYSVERHDFDSVLDLTTFDEAPFAGVVEKLQAEGIRFFTLADDPSVLQALYFLYGATMVDIPGYEARSFMTFDTWLKALIQGAGARPDWIFIAADADRLVGVTQMIAVQDHLYTNHTLVDRAYRGRGIALALKLQAIRAAIRYGALRMRAGNDSRNGPMLAVNRKLGYKPVIGWYGVVWRRGRG